MVINKKFILGVLMVSGVTRADDPLGVMLALPGRALALVEASVVSIDEAEELAATGRIGDALSADKIFVHF